MARRHRRVQIDLGTGDGRAALAAATAEPDTFVIAIDADARSMAETSRRAAARPHRGGLPNLLFVAEGVERIPSAFDGLADSVTVLFPWGSLLRGALGLDAAVAASIARLVTPGGSLEIVLSVVDRDRPAIGGAGPFGAADVDSMSRTFASLGLDLVEACPLSTTEIRATGSTWARRLRTDPDRPVWRVSLRRGWPVG
ncbi:MAG TPA: class I SAM-dependent methyltransferase [Candidatus Limnocylindrales bacterium]